MSGPRSISSKQERGILYHAEKCEEASRLADFARTEPTLSREMEASLRKLAAYHSHAAFQWVASGRAA